MNPREEGFLLLGSRLGNPERKCLTVPQLRTLAMRIAASERPKQDRELVASDLTALGYCLDMAEHILSLLNDGAVLAYYLQKGRRCGCVPVTRVSADYPSLLKQRLGVESPGVLWAKGDLSILQKPAIALVGSRDISPANAAFAAAVGREAAKQGYALLSGNARGADRIAQHACLEAGGSVISIVADELAKQPSEKNVLFLSEEGFDSPFSSPRALSRNRVIHALGEKALVAQCGLSMGGTWSGTAQNLRSSWSPVFCFRDGSEASLQLEQLGAQLIDTSDLKDLSSLTGNHLRLF